MSRERNRSARIEACIAPEALMIVKRAAEIQGRSVSDFGVAAAQKASSRPSAAATGRRACVRGRSQPG